MRPKQFKEITDWQFRTFVNSTPLANIEHLKEEVEELRNAIFHEHGEQEIRHEFADCFILLYGAAAAHGISYDAITDLIQEKFEIIKQRQWQKADKNGVIRHKKI